MEPILLIHGYSAESPESTPASIEAIYGTLPQRLRDLYGRDTVVEVDLTRYVSLDDGVNLDDVSRALDNALQRDFVYLLHQRFHVIIHSTGALVIRNWLRLFSPKPSPVLNIVYLAGANFGSGWAHIGQGQFAKWGRYVFENGASRGLKILDALELGSEATLDMHIAFSRPGNIPSIDYDVQEFIIVGSQANPSWLELPIPYAKEDGSDGVVRVAGSNLNFNYVRFIPKATASRQDWASVTAAAMAHASRTEPPGTFYEVAETSLAAINRPEIPFAIPFGCSHTGKETGIVDGTNLPMRSQVFNLITVALQTPAARMATALPAFNQALSNTYQMVKTASAPDLLHQWGWSLAAQYDPHAQLIFRLRDQDGRPVQHFDIFFDGGPDQANCSRVQNLFTDTYVEDTTRNIVVYFLRTNRYDSGQKEWINQVAQITECTLEVDFVEPATDKVKYLPFRFNFGPSQLQTWMTGHRTTIIDIEVLRLPSPEVFQIIKTSAGPR